MKTSRYRNVVAERDVLRDANERARTAAEALEAELREARDLAQRLATTGGALQGRVNHLEDQLARAREHSTEQGEQLATAIRERGAAEEACAAATQATEGLRASLRQQAEQTQRLLDWQQRAETRLNEIAEEQGWLDCPTFRSEMEAFGLTVRLPTQEFDVSVLVPVTVSVRVDAHDEDEAREMVGDDLREHVTTQALLDAVRDGEYDMHEFQITEVEKA